MSRSERPCGFTDRSRSELRRVLLVNQGTVPHYRVPVYNHLHKYLRGYGFEFIVTAEGVQAGSPDSVRFPYIEATQTLARLLSGIDRASVDAVILWVNLKNGFLFPLILITRCLLRKPVLYWGHGGDLEDPNSRVKNALYAIQHKLSDAIVLYAEHLRDVLPDSVRHKAFSATNTLSVPSERPSSSVVRRCMQDFGVTTRRNIIFVGRVERRKRPMDLIQAFRRIDRQDLGLVVVGPDPDGILDGVADDRIVITGPVYGVAKEALLHGADVFCIPGHVGLGIVDAFWAGLPLVTENVPHAPEVGFLKDGENGFMVPEGDTAALADRLELLAFDETLLNQFSEAARREIATNGTIDRMAEGFRDALQYSFRHRYRSHRERSKT